MLAAPSENLEAPTRMMHVKRYYGIKVYKIPHIVTFRQKDGGEGTFFYPGVMHGIVAPGNLLPVNPYYSTVDRKVRALYIEWYTKFCDTGVLSLGSVPTIDAKELAEELKNPNELHIKMMFVLANFGSGLAVTRDAQMKVAIALVARSLVNAVSEGENATCAYPGENAMNIECMIGADEYGTPKVLFCSIDEITKNDSALVAVDTASYHKLAAALAEERVFSVNGTNLTFRNIVVRVGSERDNGRFDTLSVLLGNGTFVRFMLEHMMLDILPAVEEFLLHIHRIQIGFFAELVSLMNYCVMYTDETHFDLRKIILGVRKCFGRTVHAVQAVVPGIIHCYQDVAYIDELNQDLVNLYENVPEMPAGAWSNGILLNTLLFHNALLVRTTIVVDIFKKDCAIDVAYDPGPGLSEEIPPLAIAVAMHNSPDIMRMYIRAVCKNYSERLPTIKSIFAKPSPASSAKYPEMTFMEVLIAQDSSQLLQILFEECAKCMQNDFQDLAADQILSVLNVSMFELLKACKKHDALECMTMLLSKQPEFDNESREQATGYALEMTKFVSHGVDSAWIIDALANGRTVGTSETLPMGNRTHINLSPCTKEYLRFVCSRKISREIIRALLDIIWLGSKNADWHSTQIDPNQEIVMLAAVRYMCFEHDRTRALVVYEFLASDGFANPIINDIGTFHTSSFTGLDDHDGAHIRHMILCRTIIFTGKLGFFWEYLKDASQHTIIHEKIVKTILALGTALFAVRRYVCNDDDGYAVMHAWYKHAYDTEIITLLATCMRLLYITFREYGVSWEISDDASHPVLSKVIDRNERDYMNIYCNLKISLYIEESVRIDIRNTLLYILSAQCKDMTEQFVESYTAAYVNFAKAYVTHTSPDIHSTNGMIITAATGNEVLSRMFETMVDTKVVHDSTGTKLRANGTLFCAIANSSLSDAYKIERLNEYRSTRGIVLHTKRDYTYSRPIIKNERYVYVQGVPVSEPSIAAQYQMTLLFEAAVRFCTGSNVSAVVMQAVFGVPDAEFFRMCENHMHATQDIPAAFNDRYSPGSVFYTMQSAGHIEYLTTIFQTFVWPADYAAAIFRPSDKLPKLLGMFFQSDLTKHRPRVEPKPLFAFAHAYLNALRRVLHSQASAPSGTPPQIATPSDIILRFVEAFFSVYKDSSGRDVVAFLLKQGLDATPAVLQQCYALATTHSNSAAIMLAETFVIDKSDYVKRVGYRSASKISLVYTMQNLSSSEAARSASFFLSLFGDNIKKATFALHVETENVVSLAPLFDNSLGVPRSLTKHAAELLGLSMHEAGDTAFTLEKNFPVSNPSETPSSVLYYALYFLAPMVDRIFSKYPGLIQQLVAPDIPVWKYAYAYLRPNDRLTSVQISRVYAHDFLNQEAMLTVLRHDTPNFSAACIALGDNESHSAGQ